MKEAELQAVYREREALEARLTKAQEPASDSQPGGSQGPEPPLMLPAPSKFQVCVSPAHIKLTYYVADGSCASPALFISQMLIRLPPHSRLLKSMEGLQGQCYKGLTRGACRAGSWQCLPRGPLS